MPYARAHAFAYVKMPKGIYRSVWLQNGHGPCCTSDLIFCFVGHGNNSITDTLVRAVCAQLTMNSVCCDVSARQARPIRRVYLGVLCPCVRAMVLMFSCVKHKTCVELILNG